MTFFVDANVLIYAAVPGKYHQPCLEVLDAIADGIAEGRSSTAVLEEVWHVERSGRAGDLDGFTAQAYLLMTPLLAVDDDAFRMALTVGPGPLGANDRLHVGTCLAHGITQMLSADRGFDAAAEVHRIDPLDDVARSALLGGRSR